METTLMRSLQHTACMLTVAWCGTTVPEAWLRSGECWAWYVSCGSWWCTYSLVNNLTNKMILICFVGAHLHLVQRPEVQPDMYCYQVTGLPAALRDSTLRHHCFSMSMTS
jgi:hypothetical protein